MIFMPSKPFFPLFLVFSSLRQIPDRAKTPFQEHLTNLCGRLADTGTDLIIYMGQGANARAPYAKSKYELVTPDAARRKGRAGKVAGPVPKNVLLEAPVKKGIDSGLLCVHVPVIAPRPFMLSNEYFTQRFSSSPSNCCCHDTYLPSVRCPVLKI